MTTSDDEGYEEDFTSWDELPGYLGERAEEDFLPGPPLAELVKFNWNNYDDLIDEPNATRRVVVDLPSGTKTVSYEVGAGLVQLLQELPSVDVNHDSGGDSPGSGSCDYFLLAAGANFAAVRADVAALMSAFRADYKLLGGT